MFGGANDVSLTGTEADTPADGLLDTFAASYKRTIEKINAHIPNVRIICIGMPYHSTADNVNGVISGYEEKRQMEKSISENYGLPFINLKEECGWNDLNFSYFLSDSVHMNAIGNQKVAEVISGKLVDLKFI